jgi:hypothetical protein
MVSLSRNNDFFKRKSNMMLTLNTQQQEPACQFLTLEGLSARAISSELTHVHVLNATADARVSHYLDHRKSPSILGEPSSVPPTAVMDQQLYLNRRQALHERETRAARNHEISTE